MTNSVISARVDRVDLREIAIQDHARGQEVAAGWAVAVLGDTRRRRGSCRRPPPMRGPVLVEGGDGQQVGDVDLVDELGVVAIRRASMQRDRARALIAAGAVEVERRSPRRRPASLRVRVLAAEDGVDLDDLPLEVERLEVVRDASRLASGGSL